jgi:hypothetical protein
MWLAWWSEPSPRQQMVALNMQHDTHIPSPVIQNIMELPGGVLLGLQGADSIDEYECGRAWCDHHFNLMK